jgi:hypothetical protein
MWLQMVPETSAIINQVTWLTSREVFIYLAEVKTSDLLSVTRPSAYNGINYFVGFY